MDPWSDDESPKTEVPAIPVPDISDIIILIGSFSSDNHEWCIAWCKHLNFIPCHCRCGVKSISIRNSTSSFSIAKPDKNEL